MRYCVFISHKGIHIYCQTRRCNLKIKLDTSARVARILHTACPASRGHCDQALLWLSVAVVVLVCSMFVWAVEVWGGGVRGSGGGTPPLLLRCTAILILALRGGGGTRTPPWPFEHRPVFRVHLLLVVADEGARAEGEGDGDDAAVVEVGAAPAVREGEADQPHRNEERGQVVRGLIALAQHDDAAEEGPRMQTEGEGPQRRARQRLGRRSEAVAKAVGGGYCRLQMPLRLALGAREAVSGHRLGALEGAS